MGVALPEFKNDQMVSFLSSIGILALFLVAGLEVDLALMGSAHGIYTFGSHLKWTWTIALGYIASILAHLYLNL